MCPDHRLPSSLIPHLHRSMTSTGSMAPHSDDPEHEDIELPQHLHALLLHLYGSALLEHARAEEQAAAEAAAQAATAAAEGEEGATEEQAGDEEDEEEEEEEEEAGEDDDDEEGQDEDDEDEEAEPDSEQVAWECLDTARTELAQVADTSAPVCALKARTLQLLAAMQAEQEQFTPALADLDQAVAAAEMAVAAAGASALNMPSGLAVDSSHVQLLASALFDRAVVRGTGASDADVSVEQKQHQLDMALTDYRSAVRAMWRVACHAAGWIPVGQGVQDIHVQVTGLPAPDSAAEATDAGAGARETYVKLLDATRGNAGSGAKAGSSAAALMDNLPSIAAAAGEGTPAMAVDVLSMVDGIFASVADIVASEIQANDVEGGALGMTPDQLKAMFGMGGDDAASSNPFGAAASATTTEPTTTLTARKKTPVARSASAGAAADAGNGDSGPTKRARQA